MGEPRLTTFLFTDIEGSTRLWEREPERMRAALARHDALARGAVEQCGGHVVKKTGDGLHAAFRDPLDGLRAVLRLQLELGAAEQEIGIALRVRCGLHAGACESRDGDYYGTVVNRAARVMDAAHGGQVLLSGAVAELLAGRLPPETALRDLGRVHLRDLASPERIFQLVHPGLRDAFPALRSLEARPNNLPHALSSFIGRERERGEVRDLLGSSRLVTLLGIGGLGKSRLALQVAADLLDAYPDGVWLVELAPVREPHQVMPAVASALRVTHDPGDPIEEALARHLRDRSLLLLLDNCEHVIEAAAAAGSRLLAAGPAIHVLATSREPLRLPGERNLPLAPLAVPGPRDAAGALELERFEAVRLFAERAAAVRPGFRLGPENAATVAAICHRLDGVPLAIELAAARVRALSVQQIALRLSDRFRLLTGGDPTALPRQRTLLACIDWSHQLLDDEERALFRRLAAFAGSWTLEAAEVVCAGEGVARERVLDVLARLVDKSLVEHLPEQDRYGFLETLREYAREQLDRSPEAAEVRGRHFDFHAGFAERARAGLVGPEQPAWLARLDAELPNLLAAHSLADAEPARHLAGLRLAGSLKHYWIGRGLVEFGHRVIAEALARAGAHSRSADRARGLFHAGQLLYSMGRFAEARAALEECLDIAGELNDENLRGATLQPLGMAALGSGDAGTARSCLEQALAVAEARGEPRGLAAAISNLAQLHRKEGAHDMARALQSRALAIARESGDRDSEALVQLNRAMSCVDRAERDEAVRILAEVAALAQALGSARIDQSLLEVCVGAASLMADWSRVARFLGAAEALARSSGLRRDPSDESFLSSQVTRARENFPSDAFAREAGAGEKLERAVAVAEARAWLQEALRAETITDR